MKLHHVLLLLLFFLGACAESPEAKQKKPANNYFLYDHNLSMQMPENYKASSKLRAEQDLKNYFVDSTALALFQRNMEMMEFDDANIDVLVDTSNFFNHVIIFDLEYLPLDKTTGGIINKQLADEYDQIQVQLPFLTIERTAASILRKNQSTYFKYKYKIKNENLKSEFYRTMYLLTTPTNTLLVHEVSANETDAEEAIASIN